MSADEYRCFGEFVAIILGVAMAGTFLFFAILSFQNLGEHGPYSTPPPLPPPPMPPSPEMKEKSAEQISAAMRPIPKTRGSYVPPPGQVLPPPPRPVSKEETEIANLRLEILYVRKREQRRLQAIEGMALDSEVTITSTFSGSGVRKYAIRTSMGRYFSLTSLGDAIDLLIEDGTINPQERWDEIAKNFRSIPSEKETQPMSWYIKKIGTTSAVKNAVSADQNIPSGLKSAITGVIDEIAKTPNSAVYVESHGHFGGPSSSITKLDVYRVDLAQEPTTTPEAAPVST